jgi:hypothetical protein
LLTRPKNQSAVWFQIYQNICQKRYVSANGEDLRLYLTPSATRDGKPNIDEAGNQLWDSNYQLEFLDDILLDLPSGWGNSYTPDDYPIEVTFTLTASGISVVVKDLQTHKTKAIEIKHKNILHEEQLEAQKKFFADVVTCSE